ncbi:unnamed protein product [Trichogramma brassicae]|uniref:U4/U6 small nuclear ribonucleoprotein Prp31 n=1 Tax=Trichogramma brassicae TaxID=86971 RepID=A0A6H5IIS5_9HYME|nr:unnamed protein product [Trichogramma brassicae]
MSLADELLADLDDDNDDIIPEPEVAEELVTTAVPTTKITEKDIKVDSIRELAKLRDSYLVQKVTSAIDKYSKILRKSSDIVGPVESDPEYLLIVEANNLAVEIDTEIATIHRFTTSKYWKRFRELESLVVDHLEYLMTVKELGNDLDNAKNNERLQQFLAQATIMVVSVTASTTQGKLLTEQELAAVMEACDMAMELNNLKQKIFEYVESRMAFIAPNLSAIVGASTAAKLMGVAGGLTKLSKMPSCNILLLGAKKTTLSGFSQVTALPHTGFIYYAKVVQDAPQDLRRKAARLVANKSTLAARVDAQHESTDAHIGEQFREEIEKKLDKLLEPPPVKFIKPLPKPIDPGRKKRGGKRVRKMKERYAVTEFRKQANRMNFADIETDAYQEDLGYTRGTIGKGLEIVNPQAAEKKVNEANAKYFSNTAGFLNVKK